MGFGRIPGHWLPKTTLHMTVVMINVPDEMKKICVVLGLLMLYTMTAWSANNHVKSVTAIGEVLGDGAKTTTVAVEYDAPISATSLSAATYEVSGREVTRVYTNDRAAKSRRSRNGNFVFIELKTTVSLEADFGPDKDKGAKKDETREENPEKQGGGMGIVAGSRPERKTNPFPIVATVKQVLPVKTVSGKTYKTTSELQSTASKTLIADDFQQFTYTDPATGVTLRYNLFIPKDYDVSKQYPLVLFMHDASGANQEDSYTLLQGNGATVWASPQSQREHPCFVLAPQYDEIVVDDDFTATASAEATIGLLDHVKQQYSIDADRVYTTGQSMGCMMSYLLMSTHPDEFAAGMLVAGQWDPKVIAPMAKKPLWLLSCTGDEKSSVGAETALKLWSEAGAKTARADWPLDTTFVEREAEIKQLLDNDATIRYSHLQGGWHNGTWRVAYTFKGIREWLFRQHK